MPRHTGSCFLSYSRRHPEAAARLVVCLREHGIPTWQDIDDLQHQPTDDELRRVLTSDQIACALVWITPEVATSETIQKVAFTLPSSEALATKGMSFGSELRLLALPKPAAVCE